MCWCFNHSKNIVLTTISDKKIPVENELLRIHNRYYYPFGSPMDGRTFGSFRFGFNTQEKVDEVYGKGNLNTALFWEYDTRLGRRWNLDPVDQISISNYAVMGNNPIANIDLDGDCFFGLIGSTKKQRESATIIAKETGGKVLNKHSKSIMVSYQSKTVFTDGDNKGMTMITQHDIYINKDGSVVPESGYIREFKEGVFDNIKSFLQTSESDYGFVPHFKFLGRMFYGMADDAFVTLSGMYYRPDKARHMTGEGIEGQGLVNVGLSTFLNMFPFKSFLSNKDAKSVNVSEFSKKYKNTDFLKGNSKDRGAKCIKENIKTKNSVESIKSTNNASGATSVSNLDNKD